SASPSSGVNYNNVVTYTLQVCNSGEPLYGPLTIIDTHNALLTGPAAWPSSSNYANPHFTYSGGNPLTMIYDGFGGKNTSTGTAFCDTITYGLYAGDLTACDVLPNAVTLTTQTTEGTPTPITKNASAAITMACPASPTPTATPT